MLSSLESCWIYPSEHKFELQHFIARASLKCYFNFFKAGEFQKVCVVLVIQICRKIKAMSNAQMFDLYFSSQ